MTATACVVAAPSSRPETARALEPKVSVIVSASEPTLAAVTTTSRDVPAVISAGLTAVSLAVPKAAATERSSW